jgi:hypothetical protein
MRVGLRYLDIALGGVAGAATVALVKRLWEMEAC